VQPDFVVVKGRAAERRDRIGAGQAVDAAAVGVSRIGPERFGDYETFCFVVTAVFFCIDLHQCQVAKDCMSALH
jgi:hypothetical protein